MALLDPLEEGEFSEIPEAGYASGESVWGIVLGVDCTPKGRRISYKYLTKT